MRNGQRRAVSLGAVTALILLLAPARSTLAQTGAAVVEYYHLDAVGSVRAVTNASGDIVRLHDFKPFGEEVNVTFPNPDRQLFTGQERDQETALDYFGARYYRPDLGRFTSADDSSFLDPYQSGSVNLYAHAFGNPLRWVDPTGNDPSCGPFGTDYCEDVYAPMPPWSGLATMAPNQDPGLIRFLWESFTRNILLTIDALAGGPVQAPGLGEANLPLVDRSPDTLFLVAAAVVRPRLLAKGTTLARTMQSEAGVAELVAGGGKVIAGAGAKNSVRDIARLLSLYGGRAEDWVKISSTTPGLETHAYKNIATGVVVELKSIIPRF